MGDAIPECSAFVNQLRETRGVEFQYVTEEDRASMNATVEIKYVMVLAGRHLPARGGQAEAWKNIKSSSPFLGFIKPPRENYNAKLKEKLSRGDADHHVRRGQ